MRWRDPLLILALALCGLALWHLGQRAGKAEALAEARRDSIEQTFAANDSLINRLAEVRDSVLALVTQRDSAYQARRTRYITLRDTLYRVDTITVPQALEALAACDDALTACDSLQADQKAALAVQDTIIAQLRPEIVRVRDLWRDAEERARDRPFGVGITCGLVAGNTGMGYGCAGGVTYRIRLPF